MFAGLFGRPFVFDDPIKKRSWVQVFLLAIPKQLSDHLLDLNTGF